MFWRQCSTSSVIVAVGDADNLFMLRELACAGGARVCITHKVLIL